MNDRIPQVRAPNPLDGQSLDVLVVGGGIVGACVARDAAMRGLAAGLCEMQDFAAGTSSRSSRLLHGGIRYLAQGRIGLVREAGREKAVLHRIAPHLFTPLPFLYPSLKGGPWSPAMLRVGTWIYDQLARSPDEPRSRRVPMDEIARLAPGIALNRLRGAVCYSDAMTNDSRLVIDTLLSAAAHGARVRNYLKLMEARRVGSAWRCRLTDTLDGSECEVEARCVVNASGPWAGSFPQSHARLRPTKGIHLVFPRERLPVQCAVVLTEGPRILFTIPWGERTYVGTTDTDYSGPLESPRVEPSDTAYLIDALARAFPAAGVREADIVASWAGLRPLVRKRDGSPSDISRSHEILDAGEGWFDVTGGKLTTCRFMAEQAVDRVARALARMTAPCRTACEHLPAPAHSRVVPPPRDEALYARCAETEWAVTRADVDIRRTGWAYYAE